MIGEFTGQLSTFLPDSPIGNSELFPSRDDLAPSPPASGGVFGALPGTIWALLAGEVLKLLTGAGRTLSGRLLLFDFLNMQTEILELP